MLFVVLTIFGSAVIWFGKLLDLDIAVITAIPIAMMWSYLAINMLPGLRVHSEQAGDNLYYMGFIFTLTSLGVSLYKFTGQASIEDVVRNFGIAIISTVMGIALRIFFNQMRRDPADIEKAVRQELAEMTRRVRAELDNSAMEFSTYRRTSNQMLSEGFEEIARQAEKNGEAVRAAIEAMSAKAVQSIEATSKKLLTTLEESHRSVAQLSESNAKNVTQLSDQMEGLASAITDKSKQLSEAIDNVIEKYAAARSPDEVLRIDVSPAVESLRTVVEAHAKAISESSADTRETAKKILAGLGPFKQTAANLTKLATEINAAAAAQSQSAEAVSGLTPRVEEIIASAKVANDLHVASSGKLSELVGSVADRHNEARAAEEQSRIRGERLERAISQMSGSLPRASSSSIDGGQEPPAPTEPIIINAVASDEDKPRRTWWQR
ncbi:methyl-accepting chemotaxis protein [Rhizobium mongolense]|uniref:Hemoglobin-like flavoprotein n=1 Tax=Rhizobium mongolense TaxID=57676 RepID=A0A7W6RTQ8_9HYPH|nr:methyl-accepting chemotaxis protein [Rhizobium mongolense]MBB4277773.1 hemoglobin-like flavoprotein [Rhizobium mongolense]